MNFDGEGNATKAQEAEGGAYMATYVTGSILSVTQKHIKLI